MLISKETMHPRLYRSSQTPMKKTIIYYVRALPGFEKKERKERGWEVPEVVEADSHVGGGL